MPGLVHIYCGEGKGKTTAAVGLAVRAAGAGQNVLFTQFYKNGSSSEICVLGAIENIQLMLCKTRYGFYSRMDEQQRELAKQDYSVLLQAVLTEAAGRDMLILDEVVSACNHGTVDEALLVDFLSNKPQGLEVVLTGRKPSERLLALADYVSEVKKIKHPYDNGVPARKGIEF